MESKDHRSIKLWGESDRRCKNNFQECVSGVVCFHRDRRWCCTSCRKKYSGKVVALRFHPATYHWEIALKSRVITVSRDELNSAMAQSLNIDPRQGFLFLLWFQRRIILSGFINTVILLITISLFGCPEIFLCKSELFDFWNTIPCRWP